MTTVAKTTEFGDGLRALAAMVDADPEIGKLLNYSLRYMSQPLDTKQQVAQLLRAALRAGAKVDKDQSDKFAGFTCSFGAVSLRAFVPREEVCEKVFVGTDTVTETVPDPAVVATIPLVEVTKTVERYEWRCASVLAPDGNELVPA